MFGLCSHKTATEISRSQDSKYHCEPICFYEEFGCPWNCCGSTVNKQMSAGIVQQALPVLFETHWKKRRAAWCQSDSLSFSGSCSFVYPGALSPSSLPLTPESLSWTMPWNERKLKKKKNLHLPTPPRTEKSFFFLSNVSVFPKWKENIPKCLRSQFSTWRQTVFWYKNDINHIDVKWLLH